MALMCIFITPSGRSSICTCGWISCLSFVTVRNLSVCGWFISCLRVAFRLILMHDGLLSHLVLVRFIRIIVLIMIIIWPIDFSSRRIIIVWTLVNVLFFTCLIWTCRGMSSCTGPWWMYIRYWPVTHFMDSVWISPINITYLWANYSWPW